MPARGSGLPASSGELGPTRPAPLESWELWTRCLQHLGQRAGCGPEAGACSGWGASHRAALQCFSRPRRGRYTQEVHRWSCSPPGKGWPFLLSPRLKQALSSTAEQVSLIHQACSLTSSCFYIRFIQKQPSRHVWGAQQVSLARSFTGYGTQWKTRCNLVSPKQGT